MTKQTVFCDFQRSDLVSESSQLSVKVLLQLVCTHEGDVYACYDKRLVYTTFLKRKKMKICT